MITLTKQEALVRPLPFVFGLIIAIIIGIVLSISREILARTGVSPVFAPDFILFLHIPFDEYFVRVSSVFSQEVLFFSLVVALIQLIGMFIAVKGRLTNYKLTNKQKEFLAERRVNRNMYLRQSIYLSIFFISMRYFLLYSCFSETARASYPGYAPISTKAISHILPLLFMIFTALSILMPSGVFLNYFYYFRNHGPSAPSSAS